MEPHRYSQQRLDDDGAIALVSAAAALDTSPPTGRKFGMDEVAEEDGGFRGDPSAVEEEDDDDDIAVVKEDDLEAAVAGPAVEPLWEVMSPEDANRNVPRCCCRRCCTNGPPPVIREQQLEPPPATQPRKTTTATPVAVNQKGIRRRRRRILRSISHTANKQHSIHTAKKLIGNRQSVRLAVR
jgi:hypothetical protein